MSSEGPNIGTGRRRRSYDQSSLVHPLGSSYVVARYDETAVFRCPRDRVRTASVTALHTTGEHPHVGLQVLAPVHRPADDNRAVFRHAQYRVQAVAGAEAVDNASAAMRLITPRGARLIRVTGLPETFPKDRIGSLNVRRRREYTEFAQLNLKNALSHFECVGANKVVGQPKPFVVRPVVPPLIFKCRLSYLCPKTLMIVYGREANEQTC